jgi:hypothetical protein
MVLAHNEWQKQLHEHAWKYHHRRRKPSVEQERDHKLILELDAGATAADVYLSDFRFN